MDIRDLVSQRLAHWVSQGKFGGQVYEAMASDPELPANYWEPETAEIYGVTTHAMKQRRARGAPPSYIKISRNRVMYTREAIFRDLARRCVDLAA